MKFHELIFHFRIASFDVIYRVCAVHARRPFEGDFFPFWRIQVKSMRVVKCLEGR